MFREVEMGLYNIPNKSFQNGLSVGAETSMQVSSFIHGMLKSDFSKSLAVALFYGTCSLSLS